MMKRFALLLLLLASSVAHGHGLTITTAGVTLRNQTHLIIRLEYDPLLLWYQVNDPTDPSPKGLAVFANMPEPAFEQGYKAMQQHLRERVRLRFEGQPVESPKFQFPSTAEFRHLLRGAFMDRVIGGQGGHPDDHRAYYQTAIIDGFLPRGAHEGSLDIDFPPTLGEVMVTFSRPHSQTLSPGDKGVHYHYQITECAN